MWLKFLDNMFLEFQTSAMGEALLVESKKETCELLGNWFGILIQLMLGFISFSTLLYKLYREKPRRPFGIWMRDSSKQAVGGLVAHAWNMLFASMLSSENKNPCVYYLVNFVVDAVLGMVFGYLCLLLIEYIAKRWIGTELLTSGYYGNPPSNKIWAIQLAEWILIVTVVKFALLYGFIVPLAEPMYVAGEWLMKPFHDYPKLELVMVMVLIPLVLNTVVFWIQDNILMFSRKEAENDIEKGQKTDGSLPTEDDQDENDDFCSYLSAETKDLLSSDEPSSDQPKSGASVPSPAADPGFAQPIIPQ